MLGPAAPAYIRHVSTGRFGAGPVAVRTRTAARFRRVCGESVPSLRNRRASRCGCV